MIERIEIQSLQKSHKDRDKMALQERMDMDKTSRKHRQMIDKEIIKVFYFKIRRANHRKKTNYQCFIQLLALCKHTPQQKE